MNNVLVTGGCGYVGSGIVHLLNKKKYNITVIDNLVNGSKKLLPKRITFIKSNINNTKFLKKKLKNKKFDLVIHCAAYADARESEKKINIYYNNNFFYAKKFLIFCKSIGIKNYIISSTCAVYAPTTKKVSEKSKIEPISIYGKSKIKLENFLIKLSNNNNLNYCILRYFNVAGADKSKKYGVISKKNNSLIKECCRRFLTNQNINIFGNNFFTKDGTTIRDYIHINDLSDIHFLITKKILKFKINKIFNCGYGVGYSSKEIANYFVKLSKNKIKIVFKGKKKGDLPISVSNNLKILKFLKWKPKFNNIKVILNDSLNWEKFLNEK